MGFPAALALALALLPACVTTKEGAAMRAETAELRARLDRIDKRDAEYKEQVARLRAVLDEATALLTRNSADLGAKVAKMEGDLDDLKGHIAELQHALDVAQKELADDRSRVGELAQTQQALQQAQQQVIERVAPSIPEDKDALWQAAKDKLAGGYWEDARRFYRSFLQRFPQDPRAPQALLATGQAYVAEQKYPLAVSEFQKVLDGYPRSPEVPEAMWQLAGAFLEMKFCGDARALLSDLQKRYPRSPRSGEAKVRIRQIEKLARDRDRCTS